MGRWNVPGVLMTGLLLGALACPATAQDWYRPAPADFRPTYERDAANRRAESWDGRAGYWGWVQVFYAGYTKRVLGVTLIHEPGWTARGQALEARLAPGPARATLREALNRLGREVAGEWAKDDAHSRIGDGDLRRWGNRLGRAAAADRGDGRAIWPTVRAVQAEADARLRGR